jgi:hypothetical protein
LKLNLNNKKHASSPFRMASNTLATCSSALWFFQPRCIRKSGTTSWVV